MFAMTFDTWYAGYPHKRARADAEKAWKKLSPADQQAAVDALPAHVAYWRARETETDFIPYPATFLRGRRWEDELPAALPAARKGASISILTGKRAIYEVSGDRDGNAVRALPSDLRQQGGPDVGRH